MSSTFEDTLRSRLQARAADNRLRQRHTLASAQGPLVEVGCERLLSFCSNDYLALANHPKLSDAAKKAIDHYGVGSGASHLVCGHSAEHHALEEELADLTGRDRALLFSTGYMANLGVINALLTRGDTVLEDRLNHASLIDGGLLSAAKLQRYHHNDMEQLNTRLAACESGQKLVVTDGVFSMDGDIAPLKTMAQLCQKHDACLVVDDAHGIGCLGDTGGGCAEHFGLSQNELPVLIGTLGKSFGSFGAFVAGSEALIESLIQFARTYIYTTALPPAVAAATRAALVLLKEESWRRDQLQALITQFRQGCEALGLELMPSTTPIQPLVLGSEALALRFSEALKEQGFWVTAIRPPTVPEGSSRLRFTFTAGHSAEQVERLLGALEKLAHLYRQEQR